MLKEQIKMDNQTTTTTTLEQPQAEQKPRNFFSDYKHFGSLSTGSKILHILLPVVVLGIIIAIVVSVSSSDYVSIVKDGNFYDYPDKTVGEAFESFFADPSWEYFESTDGKDIVEFNGKCEYYGEEVKCAIQFEVNSDDGTFEVYAAKLDGDLLTQIEINALLAVIFE